MIPNPASFRDPAAKVWQSQDGEIIRVIEPEYFQVYDRFMEVVYPELITQELILPHKEFGRTPGRIDITPEVVPFISYPYEWHFQQLKEAALVTLRINAIAMAHGLMLKDASAYNIQPVNGRMTLIDTTSFMPYSGDTPWPSYGQFLRHFVCPLLWIRHYHSDFNRLSEIYLDGIPVLLTARMLPLSTKFNAGYLAHIHSQSFSFEVDPMRRPKMSRMALAAFLGNLQKFIEGLKYKPVAGQILGGEWLKYAEAGSYTPEALKDKKEIVAKCLIDIDGHRLLDLGANTGDCSRIAVGMGYDVIAVDSDHDCMFMLNGASGILPLVVDLCNPSPGIGWANRERLPFWERIGKVDVILALALVHHLSVRNNAPLGMVAELLAAHADNLIIEWVPLEDKQAQKLLGEKKIPEYNLPVFLAEFGRRFKSIRAFPIKESGRVIYLMEGK